MFILYCKHPSCQHIEVASLHYKECDGNVFKMQLLLRNWTHAKVKNLNFMFKQTPSS